MTKSSIFYKIQKYTIVFVIFLLPRVISLGSDMSNYDASFWYPRMDSFTRNLINGRLEGTYQQYHPGVTLLLISGTSKYYFEKAYEQIYGYNPRYLPQHFVKLQIATLAPLMLIFSSLACLWYFFISKIANERFAIIFIIFLSIEPFFLGVSKFVHVTALSSILSFTAFLCLYYYYNVSSNKIFLILSCIFIGLGVLSKIDSAIMGVILTFYICIKEIKIKKNPLTAVSAYIITAQTTFYFLFPAMWVAPFTVISRIIKEGLSENAFVSNGETTIFNIPYLYYLELMIYRSSPVILFGMTWSIVLFIKSKNKIKNNLKNFLGTTLAILGVQFVIFSIPAKTNDRYLINMMPYAIIISSLVYYVALNNFKSYIRFGIFAITALYYCLIAYEYHPVYAYYHSEIFGGPKNLSKLGLAVKNRGEYYADAAKYLNQTDKQDSFKKFVILDHREQVRTFAPFYFGTTLTNTGFLPQGQKADYILFRDDYEYLAPDTCNFLKAFGPRGMVKYDVVKIYECKNIYNDYNFKN